MIVTYIRSSSVGTWDMCQQKYFMSYLLGIKETPTHIKADKGSVVHKALELLAWKKMCEQNGVAHHFDKELNYDFALEELEPMIVLTKAYEHYKSGNPLPWCVKDFVDCQRWLDDTLTCNDGMFDPRKRHVLSPEKFFDLVIDEPWARYDYINPQTGERLTGQLAVKGTIDLVTEARPGVLEYLDWKTGRRYDWAKDVVKNPSALYKDFQLLLYFYALTRLYPEYKNIFVTIFFCQDGGPYSICFDNHHINIFLRMLKKYFMTIRMQNMPSRIMGKPKIGYKCRAFCGYYRDKWGDTNTNVCDHINNELVQLGTDKVIMKHGVQNAFRYYSDGGGQSQREGT